MKYASLAATLTSKKHKVGNGSVTFHCNWHFAYEEYKEWSRNWPFCLALSSQLGFLLNGILMVDAILLLANKLWFWLKPPLSYRSLKGCHAATFGYKSGFTDIVRVWRISYPISKLVGSLGHNMFHIWQICDIAESKKMQHVRNLSKNTEVLVLINLTVLPKLEMEKKLSVTNLTRLHFSPYKLPQ